MYSHIVMGILIVMTVMMSLIWWLYSKIAINVVHIVYIIYNLFILSHIDVEHIK